MEQTALNEVITKRFELGLISRKAAIIRLDGISEEEAEKMVKDIETEQKVMKEQDPKYQGKPGKDGKDGKTGSSGPSGSGTTSYDLVFRGGYKKFSWRGQADNGQSLFMPEISYGDFATLITPPSHFTSGDSQDIQALIFGHNKNWYTNIVHVIWDDSGGVTNTHYLHDDSWFREKEVLQDCWVLPLQ